MSNVLSFSKSVSINNAARLIKTTGSTTTLLIQGQPGVGKSSILKMLQHDLGDAYEYVYLDCPTIMEGALAMDIPLHTDKSLTTYISARLKLSSGKPIVLMLDEFMKVDRLLKKMFTRLLLERIIGDTALPIGSIVFATSNNASDGVNDTLEAHVGNRVTVVKLRNPSAKEWLQWASNNGVSALTRAWVSSNPRCLASYLDAGNEENPFIFNPRKASSVSFVTPRSLVLADTYVKAKDVLGLELTQTALCGTVGVAAGDSMATFFDLHDQLTPTKAIIADPKGVDIPDNPAALLMMMFRAVDEIETQDDLSAMMQWAKRIPSLELQAVFFTQLCQTSKTMRLANRNADLQKWQIENFEVLV